MNCSCHRAPELLNDVLTRVAALETNEGQRVRRNAQVELLLVDAELRGGQARAGMLRQWLAVNEVL